MRSWQQFHVMSSKCFSLTHPRRMVTMYKVRLDISSKRLNVQGPCWSSAQHLRGSYAPVAGLGNHLALFAPLLREQAISISAFVCNSRLDELTAWLRSSIRSSASSIPTHNLMMSSGKARSFRVAGSMLAWLMRQGMLIRLFTQPKLTLIVQRRAASTIRSLKPTSPVSKLRTAPEPLAME